MSAATASRWTARILQGIVIFLLLLDAFGKLAALPPVVEGTAGLGYPVRFVIVIGLIEALCVALYAVPSTSALGAVLLTGYLGGAVASHVRIESPLMTHILAPVYIGIVLWIGLLLKDERLRQLIGPRGRTERAEGGAVTA
jgi:hypothetical protein